MFPSPGDYGILNKFLFAIQAFKIGSPDEKKDEKTGRPTPAT